MRFVNRIQLSGLMQILSSGEAILLLSLHKEVKLIVLPVFYFEFARFPPSEYQRWNHVVLMSGLMSYGGLWAAHLFITRHISHENKPKGKKWRGYTQLGKETTNEKWERTNEGPFGCTQTPIFGAHMLILLCFHCKSINGTSLEPLQFASTLALKI